MRTKNQIDRQRSNEFDPTGIIRPFLFSWSFFSFACLAPLREICFLYKFSEILMCTLSVDYPVPP